MVERGTTPKKFRFKARAIDRVKTASKPAAPSVEEILRMNLERQKAAESAVPIIRKDRRTRRTLDFWLSMAGANLLGLTAAFLIPFNPVTTIFLLAYSVMINVVLVLSFFFILDKY